MVKFRKNLLRSVDICENSSDKVESGEEQTFWFLILEQLYSFDQIIKEKSIESRKKYFTEIIDLTSKDIQNLLEKMYSYVSIHAIITVKKL